MTDTFAVGDAEVTRVVEWIGPIVDADQLFPGTPPEAWSGAAPWFHEPATGRYRAAIQTWVIRVGGLTVLVDTGVGNGRTRPQVPAFENLDTDFLDRLAAAGVTPGEVDVVVNTHIHYDHVGWNTRADGERWVPTFPNARYLVPAADYEYFGDPERMRPPETEDEQRRFAGIRYVFDDSIAPITEAGLLEPWSGAYEISDRLRLEAAPGHTPGSSVLWLRDGPGAVFVGDLLHAPVQLARPDDQCAFDVDTDRARESRRRVLAEAQRSGAWLLPAHFAGHGATTVAAHDGAYRVGQWAELAEL